MKGPKKISNAVFSLLTIFNCVLLASIIMLIVVNTTSNIGNVVGINIFLSAISLLSVLEIIVVIICLKKENEDNKK